MRGAVRGERSGACGVQGAVRGAVKVEARAKSKSKSKSESESKRAKAGGGGGVCEGQLFDTT